MDKIIAFSKNMGIPSALAFVGSSWWLIQKDRYLIELLGKDLGEDYIYLCNPDDTILMKDLAIMMGCSMDESLEKIPAVLESRLRQISELGVHFLTLPQSLSLRIDLRESPDMYQISTYTVRCDRSEDDVTLFELEQCEDELSAFQYARRYINFFRKHGVDVTATFYCNQAIYDCLKEHLADLSIEIINR